jgi:hypothetical protein
MFGWNATDLSWLEMGMGRDKVEKRLGKPSMVYTVDQGYLVVYEYNQGYIPPAEKDRRGILAAPVIILAELGTLGGLSYAANAVSGCQRGRLRVLFDTSWKIVAVKECPGQDPETTDCRETHESRRPSTLPAHFKDEASVLIDCEFPSVDHTE